MIAIRNKQFIIDGKPTLLLSGEIHYFRLQRDEWQDRIDKLKLAGCNTVASYIPWLCHEPRDGEIDLTGTTHPENDLGGFIDLCRDNGLYFFARPGPFIMAEMKNEGLPYWVYTKHPEIVPVGWDGKLAPTRTVDYLAPNFLAEARHWYAAVMPVLAERLQPNGGNVVAVQLDNEVGMLSWVSNSPDLTNNVLQDFAGWLAAHYETENLETRYPFVMDNPEIRNAAMRSPEEAYAAELLRDLGHYMRNRFTRYFAALREYAEEFGVRGVPFVVNIHGTADGRGLAYPIGVSQLYETYTENAGFIAGSDHYIGGLDARNVQDMYLINALTDAANTPEQPLASVEFEAGSGDYGSDHRGRTDPSSADFKIRMSLAQGNRLINYYLFSGGINRHLDTPVNDGNDRVAFTGERHGNAAPVNPEGVLNYTFPRMARATKAVMAVADKLAAMREERDAVAFAFIPDYYMTEAHYPTSARMSALVANLEANRGPGAWDHVVKAMLFAGFRFGAHDIQNRPLDPDVTPVLVVAAATYMDGAVQQKLVDYLENGGGMLLYGEVPQFDMEMRPCTILADALGLAPRRERHATPRYFLSLRAENWAAPRSELPTHYAQACESSRGEVLLRVVGTDEACGFDIPVGDGRAIVLSCAYTCDVPFFRKALERLGATPGLTHDCTDYGVFLTSTGTPESDERFLHLLNLDGFDKTLHLSEHGRALFDGRALTLRSKEAVMLPLHVQLGDTRIEYATAEIAELLPDGIAFRLTQPQDVIALATPHTVAPGDDYSVEQRGEITLITSRKHAAVDDRLFVRLVARN